MLRLFARGDIEEPRIVEDLRNIGVTVHPVDPETGEQFAFDDCGGHLAGYMDGCVLGMPNAPKTWAVLEIKTASDKSYKTVIKNGVQLAKPEHYIQMQMYMGWSGMARAAYFMTNKNTDDIYHEWIHFDKKNFDAMLAKAHRIITAKEPPTKINNKAKAPPCIWCDSKALCFGNQVPKPNCRNCVHSEPVLTDRAWVCDKKNLSFNEEREGCPDHILIPDLIPYATPLDGDTTHIIYEIKNCGTQFANVAATGFPALHIPHYNSKELAKINPVLLGNKTIEEIRNMFDAEITE